MSDFKVEQIELPDGLVARLYGTGDYAEIEVPSRTEDAKWYVVSIQIAKPMLHCTCLAGSYHKPCNHTLQAVAAITRLPEYQARYLAESARVDKEQSCKPLTQAQRIHPFSYQPRFASLPSKQPDKLN